MPTQPRWIASWIATGLVVGQLILVVVLGGGEVAWARYTRFVLWALAAVFGWVPIYQFKKSGGVAPATATSRRPGSSPPASTQSSGTPSSLPGP